MDYTNIIIGTVLATIVYLCLIIYKNHKITNKQKIKLLQSHLDRELIHKLIAVISQNTTNNIDTALQTLKNYYQFCTVIIYDTQENEAIYGTDNISIVHHISNNRYKILSSLISNNTIQYKLDNSDIYITPLEDSLLPKHLFIFGSNAQSTLSNEDFCLISTIIIRLLRLGIAR